MTVGSILLILTLTGLYCYYGDKDVENTKENTEAHADGD